ncbi:MAG: hypothetical protein ACREQ4_12250 [Candidatus Binataceae bacterium]
MVEANQPPIQMNQFRWHDCGQPGVQIAAMKQQIRGAAATSGYVAQIVAVGQ